MSKKEFLNRLEEALLEQMDISEAAMHIRYYREYIESEIEKGRDEQEVVESLQSPRLIAKTIINNSESANKYNNDVNGYERTKNSAYGNDNGKKITFSINGKPIDSFFIKLLLIVIAIIIVVVVVGFIIIVTKILFMFVLPTLFIIGIIGFVIKALTNKKR